MLSMAPVVGSEHPLATEDVGMNLGSCGVVVIDTMDLAQALGVLIITK